MAAGGERGERGQHAIPGKRAGQKRKLVAGARDNPLTTDIFVALADGKLNAQKAFMTGQLKVKGNIMLATKLDGVLKASKGKL